MRASKLADGALLVAALTGLWFFMGSLYYDSYDVRMRVPEGDLVRAPQTLLIQGFVLSVWLAIGAAVALLLLRMFRRRRAPREPEARAAAVVVALLASATFFFGSIVPATSTSLRLVGHDVVYPWWSLAFGLVLIAASALGALVLARMKDSALELAGSSASMAFAGIVVVFLLTLGASFDGTHAASAEIEHRAAYDTVRFHASAMPQYDNRTFFLVAHAPTGFFVRELSGPDEVLFVPERTIDGATIARISGTG